MKRFGILNLLLFIGIAFPISVNAGDFGWLRELDLRAKTDLAGFETTLSTRFKIGDTKFKLVISNVDRPADTYMVLRLCELSHRDIDDVLRVYKINHGKGWGVIAKQLGIKPGSREFHALKHGHDLDSTGNSHGRPFGEAKSKGYGKNKHKG